MTTPKLVFMPGCFDSFEGTQEELDALIKEIEESFASGDLMNNSSEFDVETLIEDEELTEDEVEQLFGAITSSGTNDRNLQ